MSVRRERCRNEVWKRGREGGREEGGRGRFEERRRAKINRKQDSVDGSLGSRDVRPHMGKGYAGNGLSLKSTHTPNHPWAEKASQTLLRGIDSEAAVRSMDLRGPASMFVSLPGMAAVVLS